MSEHEKRIAEKVAAGLAEMPDAAGSMFLYGANCLKTGYELGVEAERARGKEKQEANKNDDRQENT